MNTKLVKNNYFTLIEILVVVAIIGILASLLLPALGQARKKSKLALCTSNIRQISTALYMYTTDNDSYLPYSHNVTNGNSS
ncbi:prepilin-type N-terminal cleavage/methylation domain-containing protein [Lentisphaera profundi]|uniref:Prepilin-type N-terminal cleavage/methylation domain-containing protein n=1 Tax=Lentisphaera profundi TaxID=1658616 RepID=A0ABY7VQM4_9BACT|nr:prepilin-type N-terminal cleavage/methylation domain-containing protein [Lentisphaera profundi]WDE96500.1 prepilin-type N-terminal cleavage/methylation domain-containing protein [Lentisphaera profundi]